MEPTAQGSIPENMICDVSGRARMRTGQPVAGSSSQNAVNCCATPAVVKLYRVLPFYRVLPSFTEDYWVLLSFPKFLLCVVSFQVVWFYRVLPSFTEFYRVLPSFTEFYGSFQGFTLGLSERITGFYWVSPNFSYVSWVFMSYGFTEFYRVLPRITGFYWVSQ